MKVLEALERSKNFWFLLAFSFLFFLLRFPSLFEPNWYGDEGVYQAVGNAIGNGKLLYKEVWENKPPLLYILYNLFDSDQFALRLLSLIFGLLSIFVFYKLAKKILENSKASLISTGIFTLLFGLPILEGNIANAENFMILPILTSALILFNVKEVSENLKEQRRNIMLLFFSGLILGLTFLIKIVAIFDFAAFLIFAAFFVDEKFLSHIKNKRYEVYEVKKILYFLAGFSIPIIITAVFFILKGAFPEYINATFFSNVGYVGNGNKFIIPQGLLILKLILLSLALLVLFVNRKRFTRQMIFVWIWLGFSVFNAMFSQRPYTHYLLTLLPSFVLLLGLIFSDKSYRKINLIILVFIAFLISRSFGIYGKSLPYYGNFLSFLTHNKSVSSYNRFFDRNAPIDYELAAFIKANTKKGDNIFSWGNNAQIYKLTEKLPPGKYTVAYHITSAKNGLAETQKDLEKKKPKIIILMPYMKYYPFSLSSYKQRIIIEGAVIYERVL